MIKREELTITSPLISDINNILLLHNKYLINHSDQNQNKNGFIRVTYNQENFKSIIEDNAIVIAKEKNKIAGYYLLGHSSRSGALKYQFDALQQYKMDGIALSKLKVACGAQAILEKDFRGLGLAERMLTVLIEQVKHKYDYFFSSITKYNSTAYKVHQSAGYVIVGEDETKYFVCLNLNTL